MESICIYIILILISITISLKTNKRLGITFFVSIASISILQYLLGVAGLLNFGIYVVVLISVICLFYLLNTFEKSKNIKKYLKDNWFDLLIFTIFYCGGFIIFYGKRVVSHNELAHWGLLVKNMIYSDNLHTASANLIYVGYPPMVGMWEYWFTNFFSTFKDEYIYISNFILQISLILSTIFLLNKSKIQSLFIGGLIISSICAVSYLIFTGLFVDITLSLLFIFAIVYIYKMEKMNKSDFFILSVTLIFLELTKEIGTMFTVVVLIYLVIMQNKYYKTEIKKFFALIFIMLLLVCLSKNIWELYLDRNNLNQAWDSSSFNIENITNFITGKGQDYQNDTFKDYFMTFYSGKSFKIFDKDISQLAVLIVCTIVMFGVYIKNKDKKVLKTIIAILLFNIIYIIGLLCIYLFSFAEWEARVLLAYIRYVQIVNVINIFIALILVLDNCKIRFFPILALIIIINFGSDKLISTFVKFKENNEKTIETSNSYSEIEVYKDLFTEDDKIYVITQFDNEIIREFVLLNLRYLMVPNKLYILDTEKVTLEQLENKLRCGYTYVYMYNCSGEDLKKYSSLLEDEEDLILYGFLFKIEYDENNNLNLVQVKI